MKKSCVEGRDYLLFHLDVVPPRVDESVSAAISDALDIKFPGATCFVVAIERSGDGAVVAAAGAGKNDGYVVERVERFKSIVLCASLERAARSVELAYETWEC